MKTIMSDEKLIRKKRKKERNFTILDNSCLQNKELSFKATGLYAYLCSLPDDWVIYIKDLQKRKKDGRDSVKNGLEELEKQGFINRYRNRNEKGQMDGWITEFYEYPEDNPNWEKPITEKPITENPSLLNKQETKNLKNKKDIELVNEDIDTVIQMIEGNKQLKQDYQLSLQDKEVLGLELKDRRSKSFEETDKVSNSAPLAHVLQVLLLPSPKRKKKGWTSSHKADKWLKTLITYLKVHKKTPNTEEMEFLEANLNQFPPASWAHGIRHAQIKKHFKLDKNILPYIAEVHQYRETKNFEIFGKKNTENKSTYSKGSTKVNFREVDDLEGF